MHEGQVIPVSGALHLLFLSPLVIFLQIVTWMPPSYSGLNQNAPPFSLSTLAKAASPSHSLPHYPILSSLCHCGCLKLSHFLIYCVFITCLSPSPPEYKLLEDIYYCPWPIRGLLDGYVDGWIDANLVRLHLSLSLLHTLFLNIFINSIFNYCLRAGDPQIFTSSPALSRPHGWMYSAAFWTSLTRCLSTSTSNAQTETYSSS